MATVRYLDRKLLRNIIRHTETHNRLQEEEEMWRSRAEKAFGWTNNPFPSRHQRGRKPNRERFDGQMDRLQRMNPDVRSPQDRRDRNIEHNRDIYRAELQNHERWGHTGFMELYPEEFINKDSMDEMSNEDNDEEEKKKKKKSKHKRTHESQHYLSSSKRPKDTEGFSSSSESDISSKSSNEQQVKTSAVKKRTHCSQQSEHRSERRREPSVDRSENRYSQNAKVKGDVNYHKRAPDRNSGKSNRQLGDGDKMRGDKKRTSVDRKSKRRNKERKINDHRSKDGLHASPDAHRKTKNGVDNRLHRERAVDWKAEQKRDQSKPSEGRRRKEPSTTKGSDWSPERSEVQGGKDSRSGQAERRDGQDHHGRSHRHQHKSSGKVKERRKGEKDAKHSRRK